MHKIVQLYFSLICLLFLGAAISSAQNFSLQGQLSGWTVFNDMPASDTQFGVRYIPTVSAYQSVSDANFIDINVSAKAFAIGYFDGFDYTYSEKDISPYRIWARFAASQYELRIGLQKINFGSASIFRPLMWFDLIDPRDPLQITDGVYGALFRYYFLNNANIWLWGLYGNDKTKGWELFPTIKNKPEFGGRIQHPLFDGEAAFTYHHRQMNISEITGMFPFDLDSTVTENRYAFDGKWDIFVGFWVEAAIAHHVSDYLPYDYTQSFNIGIDYTFDIGNGLNVLTEYFVLELTEKVFSSGEGSRFSAVSVNYPLGILDNIGGIFYYDWEEKESYRFVSFRRNYDNWSFYLFGFWNPEEYKIDTGRESNQFAGKGLQVMVVFNH